MVVHNRKFCIFFNFFGGCGEGVVNEINVPQNENNGSTLGPAERMMVASVRMCAALRNQVVAATVCTCAASLVCECCACSAFVLASRLGCDAPVNRAFARFLRDSPHHTATEVSTPLHILAKNFSEITLASVFAPGHFNHSSTSPPGADFYKLRLHHTRMKVPPTHTHTHLCVVGRGVWCGGNESPCKVSLKRKCRLCDSARSSAPTAWNSRHRLGNDIGAEQLNRCACFSHTPVLEQLELSLMVMLKWKEADAGFDTAERSIS